MGQTATLITIRPPAVPTTAPNSSRFSLADLLSRFSEYQSDRRDRSRARRSALAVSEEARIHAQMRYRKVRYRHMQI